ncbi:MAG: type II toxin-antitoxin system Phd/YefM family antitoxin [Ardenticatenaceae bacterium]|nr:type II toxin-antitoxin system Phd/YefM family antitoxin [Ardenticatenaceae bacterium]
MELSIAETHNRLSQIIAQLENGPITITKRGQPVGVLITPETYEQLQRVQAYLKLLQLAKSVQNSGLTAQELYQDSRVELESRADGH